MWHWGQKGRTTTRSTRHRGEVSDDRGCDLERELLVPRDRADHRDGGLGHSADRAGFLQFEKAIKGICDIGIGFREDTDRRSVCDQQFLDRTLAWQQAVTRVLRLAESLLVGKVGAARCHDPDRCSLERNRERGERRRVEPG